MSKLFDAMEKAAADRAALHNEPQDAGPQAPAPSSELPTWRRAPFIAIVVGFVVATVIVPRLLERQRSSAPLTPSVGESQKVQYDAPSRPSFVEAPLGPTAQPTVASGMESKPIVEAPAHVAAAAPEPAAPEPVAAPADSVVPPARRGTFSVQMGAFKNRENAVRLQAQLAGKNHPATIHAGRVPGAPSAVHVGPYLDWRAAEAARIALARDGFAGFVVHGEHDGTARQSFAASK